jgi:hypothetical protein
MVRLQLRDARERWHLPHPCRYASGRADRPYLAAVDRLDNFRNGERPLLLAVQLRMLPTGNDADSAFAVSVYVMADHAWAGLRPFPLGSLPSPLHPLGPSLMFV